MKWEKESIKEFIPTLFRTYDSLRVAGPVETGASPFAFGSFDAGSFDDDHAASFAGDVGVAAVAAAAAVATPFDASFVDDATPTDRRIHSDGPLAIRKCRKGVRSLGILIN